MGKPKDNKIINVRNELEEIMHYLVNVHENKDSMHELK